MSIKVFSWDSTNSATYSGSASNSVSLTISTTLAVTSTLKSLTLKIIFECWNQLLPTPADDDTLTSSHESEIFFFFYILFIFREKGREGEKHWCVRKTLIGCLLHTPSGGLAGNPGMCPDQELNWWPFSLQAGTQSTEPPVLRLLEAILIEDLEGRLRGKDRFRVV